MKEAPLFAHAYDLAAWVSKNLPAAGPLEARVHAGTLDLLDAVVLALKGLDRSGNLDRADAAAVLLRVHLRLLHEVDGLDEHRLLFLTGQIDAIGRQIGGWLRRLESDTLDARHR
ncbi:four helix bundle protein [Myxococcota bacterium]|nr:four helix bundle protein [Myxococcota bacterium]